MEEPQPFTKHFVLKKHSTQNNFSKSRQHLASMIRPNKCPIIETMKSSTNSDIFSKTFDQHTKSTTGIMKITNRSREAMNERNVRAFLKSRFHFIFF